MFQIETGRYVVHSKLPELGRGEVLDSEAGFVRIRFASGERNFQVDFVSPYLSLTTESLPAPKARASIV